MTVAQQIENRLRNMFSPSVLEIINESEFHSHHQSSPGTGESHFRIKIRSDAFAGKSRVECHRMINDALAEHLKGPVHALAIDAKAA